MIRAFRKYFVAHEGNDHHPHFFRSRSVAALIALIVVVEAGLFFYAGTIASSIGQKAAVIANALVEYTNDARFESDLPPLVRSPLLDLAAKKKAEDMIAKGYFAHYSPEGVTPWHWLDVAGYRYESAGENLAIDFFDSKDVVRAWLDSPGHRRNIMKQKYTEIGMAVATGQFEGQKTIFVVQFFGKPAAGGLDPVAVLASSTDASLPAAEAAASATPVADADADLMMPTVAGASIDIPVFEEGMFARATSEMFGFAASPRNAAEVVLFALIALVIAATVIYIRGSKKPSVNRIVASVSIALLMTLSLAIMMNRTLLRMSSDSAGPGAETSMETDIAS